MFVFNSKSMQEIFDGIFRAKIPLPGSPLKYVNSYIFDGDPALVIDTGFNTEESFLALKEALDELKIKNVQFFITHIHADHIGLVGRYGKNSRIFISREEYKIIEKSSGSSDYWIKMNEYLLKNGFPEDDLKHAFNILNKIFIGTYPDLLSMKFLPVEEGNIVDAGRVKLSVIFTPGHSPGHACLYDHNNKLLFSGDHILFTITPNITWWPTLENSLEVYMESLKKIRSLPVEKTFPGHGEMGVNPGERIDEILEHHERRLHEILDAMDGEMTAYEVAASIKWNVMNGEWNIFPRTQKYFALGETIAHLIYLEKRGFVKKYEKERKIYYKKTSF